MPNVALGKRTWRQGIGRIAPRRAGIDPRRDRSDLFVSEGAVLLEALHTDISVYVPRRHSAG